MDGVCDAHRRDKRCIHNIYRETRGNETTLKAYANISVYY